MVSLLTVAALAAYYRLRQRKRRFGVHPILRKRKQQGHLHTLFKDLQRDPQRLHRSVRMDHARFNKLLELFKHRLVKHSRREPLSPAERLLITLRFLATGDSPNSLSSAFYVGVSTMSVVVAETCNALAKELMPTYAVPVDRRGVAEHRRGILAALGPAAYATTVLLAMRTHRYRIIYANWHKYGSSSDAGIFDRSELKRMLKDTVNPLNFPAPKQLPLDPVATQAELGLPSATARRPPLKGMNGIGHSKKKGDLDVQVVGGNLPRAPEPSE